ncbi:hypothetical protein PRZ48_008924 [Zasmidium cellare]|uniref:SGNH hydrolase-type esterase domain-containing protein n=1 Tax=Zasmidium cellare TaxID=395010 RepID=A0ABR0EGV1_ZASCE|nr:hypothetical protein PRZ48_008924 [Zasmidium cellare]
MGAYRYGVFMLAAVLTFLTFGLLSEKWESRPRTAPKAKYAGCPVSPDALMRIMPVGDSLTEGMGSSDYNGYRLFLYNLLMEKCSERYVEFIGSQHSGSYASNDMYGLSQTEGYSGYSIDHFLAHSREGLSATLARNPSVILLHIGTNDMSPLRVPNAPSPATAPERLTDLIDIILTSAPNAVLLVAQLVHSPNAGWTDHSPAYNAAIPRIVARKQRKGYKIMTVDMRSVGAECVRNLDGSDVVCEDLIEDGVHPRDKGYEKMAAIWYEGLRNATNRGYFAV